MSATLTPERMRQVESVWHHRRGAWVAPFETVLTDVMVHAFYDADDYDEVRAHLVATFGGAS
jgi:hypothetical protein